MANNKIAESTLKRMSDYLCILKYLREHKVKVISSSVLARMMNITDSQIRKDLSYFGSFGKKGVGYSVDGFIQAIEEILNLQTEHRVCIVGAGRLGSALINYKRLNETPFKVVAAFDKNKKIIGKKIGNVPVYDIKDINKIIKKMDIEIALLTVPSYVVHDVYAKVAKSDVRAILNFTPIVLTGNDDILVRNLDFVSELKIISYFLKEQDNVNKNK